MVKSPKYSVIIPVYNRPDEISELLESLTRVRRHDYEVLIIEDGSTIRCDHVVEQYSDSVPLRYFFKPNEGPGPARNFGYHHAAGNYLVCFDSDCVIPPRYFDIVDEALSKESFDAWGGPDRPHEDFTLLQRAMGYTMSSVLTTGGIRGQKKRLGWFQPRSFNMGISRAVFEKLGGFALTRQAEDIEFSIRMRNAGFKVVLLDRAFVYHRRRTSLAQFFRQVFNFGRGRAIVGKLHPGEVKLTHWFPALFTMALVGTPVLAIFSSLLSFVSLTLLLLYLAGILLDASITNRNVIVGLLAIPAALVQLTGYGLGFLTGRFASDR